jgi:hypothetical protein
MGGKGMTERDKALREFWMNDPSYYFDAMPDWARASVPSYYPTDYHPGIVICIYCGSKNHMGELYCEQCSGPLPDHDSPKLIHQEPVREPEPDRFTAMKQKFIEEEVQNLRDQNKFIDHKYAKIRRDLSNLTKGVRAIKIGILLIWGVVLLSYMILSRKIPD